MLCIFEMFSKKNLHRRKKDFFHVEWGVDEMVKNGRPLIDYMDITPSVLFFLSSQRYVDADDEKKNVQKRVFHGPRCPFIVVLNSVLLSFHLDFFFVDGREEAAEGDVRPSGDF